MQGPAHSVLPDGDRKCVALTLHHTSLFANVGLMEILSMSRIQMKLWEVRIKSTF